MFLDILQNTHMYSDTVVLTVSESPFLQETFYKETLAQVFSFEFCEISKNSFSTVFQPRNDCFDAFNCKEA